MENKKEIKAKTAPEDRVAVPTPKPENFIAVLGTRNEEFRNEVLEIAKKYSINVAQFSDELIDGSWLLNAKVKTEHDKLRTEIEYAIKNENMRKASYNQASKILEVITNGTVLPYECKDIYFTQTELVKKSTLKHKQAAELLDALHKAGRVQWINKKRQFQLVFNNYESSQYVFDALEHDLEICKDLLVKYEALIKTVIVDYDNPDKVIEGNGKDKEEQRRLLTKAKNLIKTILLK
jgi:hypothetical protein